MSRQIIHVKVSLNEMQIDTEPFTMHEEKKYDANGKQSNRYCF